MESEPTIFSKKQLVGPVECFRSVTTAGVFPCKSILDSFSKDYVS